MTPGEKRTLVKAPKGGAAQPESPLPFGEYTTRRGEQFHYTVQGCDWDLDHPGACLLTFVVKAGSQTFEKVIAVDENEATMSTNNTVEDAVIRAAEQKLYAKLEAGNLADEPTPLR